MFRIVVSYLLVLALTGSVGAAGDDEFSTSFFCGWDGYYRPMEWTPIEIGIDSDLTEPFGGTFIVSAPQDGLNTLNIMHRFVLTPESPQSIPLVTKFAFGAGRCNLEIRDQRGRTQWESSIDMWDFRGETALLRPLQPSDLLIGVIGQPRFGLLRVPRETVCRSTRGGGKVCVGRKVAQMVPWDWTGFTSLDVLVLYDPDWTLLRPEQMEAVVEWVQNGGTLFVILGRHFLPQDCPIAQMLPFDVGEPRQVEIAAETFSGWGLDPNAPETVTLWPLFARPTASVIDSTKAGAGGYVHAQAHVGFGRVTALAFDPAELDQKHLARTANFWVAHVGLCLGGELNAQDGRLGRSTFAHGRTIDVAPSEEEEEQRRSDRNRNHYRISTAQRSSNQVMEYLYNLAEMRPLSIWWVILTLTGLAVILGPLDYLVLKRFDKLPYTWLTSTGWIIIFTVGAYYGVQALRGGSMQLRAVTVLDGIANSDCAWGTYYTGLYSPRSADYQLEGLNDRQWWSGIAPTQEEMWSYQRTPAMRQIHCLQEDGANLPVSVPINIWTVQSLLTEARLERMPLMATVERVGDRCIVEITNTSDDVIRGGAVLLANGYVDFQMVSARSTQRFEVPIRPFNPWQTNVHYNPADDPQPRPQYPARFTQVTSVASDAFLAQGCFERALAMHSYLDHGAALVCVEFEDAAPPVSVKDRSYKINHIKLARMVVFPKEGS